MEDALVPASGVPSRAAIAACLNPCFNGRCTRTIRRKAYVEYEVES